MSESKALAPMERAKLALADANEQALTALAAASKSITVITNADGYQQCHTARMALKVKRVDIEKIGKAAREDATAFSRAVIAEEKRLVGIIQPEEDRLGVIQKAWDDAREAEKRAKAEAEALRVQEIQKRLAKLQTLPEVYTSALAPARILDVIEQIEGGLTYDYQEFADQAEAARQAALVSLRRSHVEAIEREERQAAAEAERAAQAAREAAEHAEQERIAAEARKAEEARLQAERERLAEETRRMHERRAREEAEQTARLKAERDAFEAQQAKARREAEIMARIAVLRGPTHLTATDSPVLIEQELKTLMGAPVRREDYAEWYDSAMQAKGDGMERLANLFEAAKAHCAEQQRLTAERVALAEQERAQAERQAEIERKEREAREAEEKRKADIQAELDRKSAEAAIEREAEQRRKTLRQQVGQLSAADIASIVADEIGVELGVVAARIAEIEHQDWAALSMTEQEDK